MSPVRVALLLFAVGTAAVWLLTHAPLPALSPDSASYLAAAESLSQGAGLRIPMAKWWSPIDTEPLRHFPPGFSLLIALGTALGAAPVQAARAIEALAGGATLAISALTVAAASGSTAGGVMLGVLLLLTPALVQGFMPVLSEPLFLSLVALLVYLLSRDIDVRLDLRLAAALPSGPARFDSLLARGAARFERPLLVGAVAAAGAMVRYAGISLTATCVLCYLAAPGTLWLRLRRALLAGVPTLLALWLWQRSSGQFRKYGRFSAGLLDEVWRAGDTLAASLAPGLSAGGIRAALACAALGLIAALAATTLRTTPECPAGLRRLVYTAALFIACYTLAVVAARSFADPGIEFDWRTLSPVLLVAETVLAALLATRMRGARRTEQIVCGALATLWIAGASVDLERLISKAHRVGYGYEAAPWQRSELAAWLQLQSTELVIYTNNTAALWHLAHRKSRTLPGVSDPETLRRFARVFERTPSAIVEFPNALEHSVDADALVLHLGDTSERRFDRGTVWLSRRELTQRASSSRSAM